MFSHLLLSNISLVFLLCILVYIGIRIMFTSTAADTAKYKKMLIDWVVALCLLFVLHYIMAAVNTAIEINKAIKNEINKLLMYSLYPLNLFF